MITLIIEVVLALLLVFLLGIIIGLKIGEKEFNKLYEVSIKMTEEQKKCLEQLHIALVKMCEEGGFK